MSLTVSVRIKPIPAKAGAGQARHDLRSGRVPGYVDHDKSTDNSLVIAPPDPSAVFDEIASGRKAARQQSLRQDARVVIAGVVTWGTEAQERINALSVPDQDALYRRICDRISRETGRDLIGLVVHRDESSPHCHFMLRGYQRTESGQEIAPRFQPKDLQKLQDAAGQEVADLGISRGKSIGERIADGDDYSKTLHRSVKELHRDIPDELQKARHDLALAEEKAVKARELLAKTEAKIASGTSSVADLDKRLETKTRRLASAEKSLKEAREKVAHLQALVPVPVTTVTVAKWPRDERTGIKKAFSSAPQPVFSTMKVVKASDHRDLVAHMQARKDEVEAKAAKLQKAVDQGRDWARRAAAKYQAAGQEAMHGLGWFYQAIADGVAKERYGVIVIETAGRVVAPPQEASAQQLASALYRSSREAGWKTSIFNVQDDVAAEIVRMAVADGRGGVIVFSDESQQKVLDKAFAASLRTDDADDTAPR